MLQEMTGGADDISTADGLLEFYKKLKNPEPIEDLHLDSDPFGVCLFTNENSDEHHRFVVKTEETLDLIE